MKWVFLLTRPSRGATDCNFVLVVILAISTHTPLAGRDEMMARVVPRGFISTHTPLAGRDPNDPAIGAQYLISTHTPLAGRDTATPSLLSLTGYFYSHAPRGARRPRFLEYVCNARFLLTRPSRGATRDGMTGQLFFVNFYSHAPRGARRCAFFIM